MQTRSQPKYRETARRVLSQANHDNTPYLTMGAEDMAFMQEKVNGLLFLRRLNNAEKHLDYGSIHTPKFDFDEQKPLINGVALMSAAVMDILKLGKQTNMKRKRNVVIASLFCPQRRDFSRCKSVSAPTPTSAIAKLRLRLRQSSTEAACHGRVRSRACALHWAYRDTPELTESWRGGKSL